MKEKIKSEETILKNSNNNNSSDELTNFTNNKKAAIYIRVANTEESSLLSIEKQKEQITKWCEAKQIKNYDYYIDCGFSGNNLDRPELARLLKDIKEDVISHCIIYNLDRLSRSAKDMLYLIEDVFERYNITLVSLQEGMDTSKQYGQVILSVKAAFCMKEIEDCQTMINVIQNNKHMHSQKGGSNG